MKVRCIDCGEQFDDGYKNVNQLNKRIWCNSCVEKRYRKDKDFLTFLKEKQRNMESEKAKFRCLKCNKIIPKEYVRKYCSRECYDTYYSKNKDKVIKRVRQWQLENKDRVKSYSRKAVLKYYHNQIDKTKYKERMFANRNKILIENIIGKTCKLCKKDYEHFHHISYDNLPHDSLYEYCKFLIPLCSDCHLKIHREKDLNKHACMKGVGRR